LLKPYERRKGKNITYQLDRIGKATSARVVGALGVALVVGGTAIGALVGCEIISRLMGKPLTVGSEIAIFIVMWVYMLGAAYSISNRSYLQGAIVSMVFAKRPRVVGSFKVGTSFLSVVLCFILSVWGYRTSVWDFHSHPKSALLLLPQEWSRLSLVVCFTLCTIYFFVEFICALQTLWRDKKASCSGAGTKC